MSEILTPFGLRLMKWKRLSQIWRKRWCVCVCVCACVRACVRACVCVSYHYNHPLPPSSITQHSPPSLLTPQPLPPSCRKTPSMQRWNTTWRHQNIPPIGRDLGLQKVSVVLDCIIVRSDRRAVPCGVVWCGVVWCGVVWCGVVCMGLDEVC